MEAFSLLKYWRSGGGSAGFINGSGGGGGENGRGIRNTCTTTTTIVTAVSHHASETDDDDGPFFDLEFAVEEEDDGVKNDGTNNEEDEENRNDDVSSHDDCTDQEGEEEEEEREFNITISSNNSSSNDHSNPNLTLSPSDDLFFKGRLVPVEPSSLVFNSAEPNSKSPQFPISLLKSATKFRVAMLGFKKSKQNASEKTEPDKATVAATSAAAVIPDNTAPKQQQPQKQETEKEKQSKFFTVKFKVEEVPIVSLFTRDNNSSRKSQKQSVEDSASSDEKKFSKDVMQKYLKKVKPLYIRVSKRYGDKLKFSGQLSLGSGAKTESTPLVSGQKTNPPKPTAEKSPPESDACEIQVTKSQKQANIPERLRVVCKQLGKSRSASSAVAAAPPQPTMSRRDDSLLQQQDGIQSAILHCKRSLNASRDSESSILPRSVSDRSHQKSVIDLSGKSPDELKDGSFES